MKKIISLLLVLVMSVSVLCIAVNAEAKNVVINASEAGIDDKADIGTVSIDGVTLAFGAGTNTSNTPKYYANGEAFRVYKNNVFSVKAETEITSITFTFPSSDYTGDITVDAGTYTLDGLTGKWTGSAKEINFTNGNVGQARLKKIEVAFGGSSAPATEEPEPEPTPTTPKEIVEALYKLEKGKVLAGGPYTLEGVIKSVDTAYNDKFKNVTVTIIVEDMTDKPVQCFRLEGEHAAELAVGDTIKVEGQLKRYNDTYEFDAACKEIAYKKGEAEQPEQPTYTTPEEILNAAYALDQGAALPGTYTLTGKITAVNTVYSERYGNVTVTMAVEGFEDKPVQCFRMINKEGVDGVDKIASGDTITVTGILKNYNGTVEFDANCTLDAYTIAEKEDEKVPETVDEILEALYALKDNESLAGPFTLTGVVKTVDTLFSTEYNNVTVTIVVEGHDDKPVMCYRLEGENADKIEVGDTITVTGSFKNYKGTYEFNQGCKLDELKKANKPTEPDTPTPDTSDASVAVAVFAGITAIGAAALIVRKKRV